MTDNAYARSGDAHIAYRVLDGAYAEADAVELKGVSGRWLLHRWEPTS